MVACGKLILPSLSASDPATGGGRQVTYIVPWVILNQLELCLMAGFVSRGRSEADGTVLCNSTYRSDTLKLLIRPGGIPVNTNAKINFGRRQVVVRSLLQGEHGVGRPRCDGFEDHGCERGQCASWYRLADTGTGSVWWRGGSTVRTTLIPVCDLIGM